MYSMTDIQAIMPMLIVTLSAVVTMVAEAWGMTAPEESVTVPLRVAVKAWVCAWSEGRPRTIAMTTTTTAAMIRGLM